MKKFLIILFLFLLNVSAHADRQEERFSKFNKWLVQNEFKDYYKLGFAAETGKCKDLKKVLGEIKLMVKKFLNQLNGISHYLK